MENSFKYKIRHQKGAGCKGLGSIGHSPNELRAWKLNSKSETLNP